ncbi:MAG: right-handed parallel beta-helix repeat-containing protein [Phycisphaerales bacterium]
MVGLRTPSAHTWLFSLAALATAAPGTHAATTFVDANLTTGANDGSSWANAFRGRLGLQTALGVAQAGDEVWVADGTYAPAAAGAPRTSTFLVPDGVAIYGGFAGGETSPAQRNIGASPSLLSGDLAMNGNSQNSDNAYHVVTALNLAGNSLLDGFTIQDGTARLVSADGQFGGGMLVQGGTPVIRNCTFRNSDADRAGGGLALLATGALVDACSFQPNTSHSRGYYAYHGQGSTATFRACTFTGAAPTTGGAAGVGVYSGSVGFGVDESLLTVEDCTFSITTQQFSCPTGVGIYVATGQADIARCSFVNNTTCGGGGGVSGEGVVRIDRCAFIGNEGQFDGGAAIHTFDGTFTVTNSLFAGNDRTGFSTFQSAGPTEIINCTFYANGASNAFHSVILAQSPTLAMRNCIFWGNLANTGTQNAVANAASQYVPRFDDCIVQGWNGALPGARSFTADPLFVSPLGADNTAGTADDNLRLQSTSPAIDHGNNTWTTTLLDFAGLARRQNAPGSPDLGVGTPPFVDIGPYEAPGSTCDPTDFNNDGLFPDTADIDDFLSVFSGGPCSNDPNCHDIDFNNDGLFPDTLDIDSLLSVISGGACL